MKIEPSQKKEEIRFFKADLHFHTPASADARGSKLKEAGFRIDEWGVVAATGRTSVYNTIEFVTRRGGIVIPAHIDGSDQALLQLFRGQTLFTRQNDSTFIRRFERCHKNTLFKDEAV